MKRSLGFVLIAFTMLLSAVNYGFDGATTSCDLITITDSFVPAELDAEGSSWNYNVSIWTGFALCSFGNDAVVTGNHVLFEAERYFVMNYKPNDLYLGNIYDLTAIQFD